MRKPPGLLPLHHQHQHQQQQQQGRFWPELQELVDAADASGARPGQLAAASSAHASAGHYAPTMPEAARHLVRPVLPNHVRLEMRAPQQLYYTLPVMSTAGGQVLAGSGQPAMEQLMLGPGAGLCMGDGLPMGYSHQGQLVDLMQGQQVLMLPADGQLQGQQLLLVQPQQAQAQQQGQLPYYHYQ
jgi:hypothetical protein